MRERQMPELLCPAGSFAALEAAIEGGADAVYMGGTLFNARIHAKNFTPQELERGIALTHSYGVKVYIAANTLIYDREIEDFLRAAEEAYLAGADALIVADVGCAAAVHRRLPIELHASTQLSGHNAEAARRLAACGFSRMVCAREMSREDLAAFTAASPIEAEVFVHGALCVCHSGQCLFSSLVGGRSGNRGECAQPCRLPYGLKNGKRGFPLSLRDLSLAEHLPELARMGVASLKIEGRMKSPEYVRDVAAVFRRLLDEGRGASREDMAELASVFSRDGFTDGYYRRSLSSSMFGVRREEDKEKTREREPFRGLTRRLPVCLSARIQQGIPAVLALSSPDGTLSLTVEGAVPEKAKTAPLTEETVRRQLTKLGGSGLEARSLSLTLEDGLMLPVSALNALRRGGAERYTALLQASVTPDRSPEGLPASTAAKRPVGQRTESKTAVFYDPKAIPAEAFDYFGHIFVPVERYDGSTDGVLLPPVIFDSERPAILAALKQAREQGARHALVGNLGHLDLAREAGLTVHGDFRLNVCNRESAAALEELGVEDGILSPELTLPRMRDVGGATAAIVYGRVPLMVTETCLGKAASGCEACDNGRGVLVDRKGVRFPILRLPPHRNLVLNSVPVYMADRKAELMRAGLTMQHFIFTVESKAQAAQVILAYQQQLPPSFPVCRIR